MKSLSEATYVLISWLIYSTEVLVFRHKDFPFTVGLGVVYMIVLAFLSSAGMLKSKVWVLAARVGLVIIPFYTIWFLLAYWAVKHSGWELDLFDFSQPDKMTFEAFIVLALPLYIYPVFNVWVNGIVDRYLVKRNKNHE